MTTINFEMQAYTDRNDFARRTDLRVKLNVPEALVNGRIDNDFEYYQDDRIPALGGVSSYSILFDSPEVGPVYLNVNEGRIGYATKHAGHPVCFDVNGQSILPAAKKDSLLWPRVTAVLKVAPRVLLWGKPGTGKTTAAFMVDPENTYKTTVHDESSAAELIGHYLPNGAGKFTWHDGIGTAAWRQGKRLLIDEIDKAGGDFQTAMYAIADDPQVARLYLPTGEIIQPAPGFQVVLTMNGTPKDLPSALRDRFSVNFDIDEPNPAALASLSAEVRNLVASTMQQADPERGVSVRAMKAFEELQALGVDRETAAFSVLGTRAADFLRALALQKA